MSLRTLVRAAHLALLAPAVVAQTQVSIAPSRDNTLYEDPTGSLSNGAGSRFFCGLDGHGRTRRAVIAFDVGAVVPAGATIISAQLELEAVLGTAGPALCTLHRVLEDWGEGSSLATILGQQQGGASMPGDATWIHRSFPDEAWSNPGGTYAPAASATATVDQPGSYRWTSTAAMVADVQSWLDDPTGNFGWMIRTDEATLFEVKAFATKEEPVPALRPALRLSYTMPASSTQAQLRTALITAPDGDETGVAVGPVALSVPGTTYYVDAQSGNDLNSGLTRASALRTIAAGVGKLAAGGGDKLVLRGTFAEELRIPFINSPRGTPDPTRPTVVQCDFDAAGRPLEARIDGGIAGAERFPFDKRGLPAGFGPGTGNYLQQGIVVSESAYVTVSGIDVIGIAGQGVLSWKSSHVAFEHLTVAWTAESAMLFTNGGPTESLAEDLTVAHCRIDQCNLGGWVNRATQQGYNMNSEALSVVSFDGFRIHSNHLSNSAMEGIAFKVGARNGVIRNNVVENTRAAGIYSTEGLDTVVSQNLVRRVGWYDPEDGTGLTLAAPYLSSKLPFTLTADGASGIRVGVGDFGALASYETGRTSGIDVYENVISWTLKAAVAVGNDWRLEGRTGWLIDDIHIYNNVAHRSCQGTSSGPAAVVVDVGLTHGSITNTIFVESAQSGIEIVDESAGSFFATNTISHNMFWRNLLNGTVGNSPRYGDPLFVSPPSTVGAPANFELQPGSPAIDAGLFRGLPTGGTPTDIGAYQHGLPPWGAGVAGRP